MDGEKKSKVETANGLPPRVYAALLRCHMCKNRPSWVGFTIPGKWAPSLFSKSATSTYLLYASALGSALPFPFPFSFLLNSTGTGAASARSGSHFSPRRVPLVRNSCARYPARSWLR
uniref:Uncharacterized protein n=1 Tax=Vitis vinifera TaxID=29760 RepID=F6HZM5_VITVI